jgi:NADPH-dependent FMN reductase
MTHVPLTNKRKGPQNKTRNVAVLVGSLRKDSINRKVAKALVEVAPEGLKLSFVDIGQLPIYNQDGDEKPPAEWTAFRERISAVDAVLFVTPLGASGPEKRYRCRLPALWQERMER